MPIECSIEVNSMGQERFHAVDRLVMGHAFDIHNTLGRFCDERIYQDELAQRCRASGLEVHREVLLRAVHQGFAKPYYLDMLIERGYIYELKAAEAIDCSHQKQLINYLLLAALCHGKLVNFRPGSVESRFVSTSLSRADRVAFRLGDGQWQGDDESSQLLMILLSMILSYWNSSGASCD